MCPSLIEIGSKTAEKNSAQTNRQTDIQTNKQTDIHTDRHYENNGHLAVNQLSLKISPHLKRVATGRCKTTGRFVFHSFFVPRYTHPSERTKPRGEVSSTV